MKYSWEFKLECVEEYMRGRWKEKPNYTKLFPALLEREK